MPARVVAPTLLFELRFASCRVSSSVQPRRPSRRAHRALRVFDGGDKERKRGSGSQWVHEIKLDGYRMAARIERGEAKLLTRTGLDWTARYPGMSTALAAVRAKTAYLDGELCGVGADGLPSFAEMQAATDGAGACVWFSTPSTFCILTAATRRACRSRSARRCCSRS
jgi:ATP dependent DNA ligase domain